MRLNVEDLGNIFHQIGTVITRSIQNDVNFLRKRIDLPNGTKIRHIFRVNARIFTNNGLFNTL